MELANDVIFLLGPTASGKSRWAMEVARETGAEICSVDAFQIYRGLDIGTAKPSGMAQKEIPHHLLDLVEPEQGFTAADYLRSSGNVLEALRKRKKKAVWVGGTGLYHKVLTEGLAKAPGTDLQVAAELEKKGALLSTNASKGVEASVNWEKLASDLESATRDLAAMSEGGSK